MEWWLKGLLTIGGVTGGIIATHYYNDYYRQQGIEHPITKFIREHMPKEEEDRLKRIEDIQIQSKLSEARLAQMSKKIPILGRDSSGSASYREPIQKDVAWKSEFTE